MKPHRCRALVFILFVACLSPSSLLALDRAPEILGRDQVAASIRLLWAPGGQADGTLDPTVTAYAVEKQGLGLTSWTTVFSGNAQAMTYVDSVAVPGTWDTYQGQSIRYRVRATSGTGQTLSPEVSFVPSLPLWVDEALDGKARLTWVPSNPRGQYTIHLGYKVEKWVSGNWVIISGSNYIQTTSYIDATTAPGTSQYRVRTVYKKNAGATTDTRFSNTGSIQIQAACAGQPAPSLPVIQIGDLDSDTDYDGDDIASALTQCAGLGGCVLRALPVTYDNVAIRITDRTQCDASPTFPLDCLPLNFPAGLVIEGHGRESVFRSPLWQSLGSPVPFPAPVLEVHRRDFQVTLRNLVLDGRKFAQEPPGTGIWSGWWYGGLYVWNTGPWLDHVREIAGDNIGDEDGYCDPERCVEAASGNDGDGSCEPGEACLEHPQDVGIDPDNVCSTDIWKTAPGCESSEDANDGCLHNVEVRDIPGAHAVLLSHANRWIVEDSEIHDVGCVNRGFGYDCPHFASAADASVPAGFKTYGIALSVGPYTADLQVRGNTVQRATKYGLSFDNDKNTCNGLNRNHEVEDNDVRDIGAVGIFNHGSVGARIHDNTIENTTTWEDPPAQNGNLGPFGMSLGGFCTDDNEFYANDIVDSGGMAIMWNGASETVACSAPGTCAPVTAVGNRIYQNAIDGVCTERDATLAASPTFGYGAILAHMDSAGKLLLEDNALTGSLCRHTIQAYGPRDATVGPFELRVTGPSVGSSYESGPNVVTRAQGGFYCGAVHVYGANRKLFIADADDNSFINADDAIPKLAVPKACAGHGATFVLDDVADPYDADFTAPENVGGTGTVTIVQCSQKPTPCDEACQLLYADCD